MLEADKLGQQYQASFMWVIGLCTDTDQRKMVYILESYSKLWLLKKREQMFLSSGCRIKGEQMFWALVVE